MAGTWLKGSKEGGQFGVFVKILSLAKMRYSLASDGVLRSDDTPGSSFSCLHSPFRTQPDSPHGASLPPNPSDPQRIRKLSCSTVCVRVSACVRVHVRVCVRVPIADSAGSSLLYSYTAANICPLWFNTQL